MVNQQICSGSNPSTVTDIDGNVYNTITIGAQVWMQENLKTSKYRNGDPITTSLDSNAWSAATSGGYAIYNDDPTNNIINGKLYNFYAVEDIRGLCPAGWHVPNDAEWTNLELFLGMPSTELDSI
jgi:uncharacterized protein (TIGR02145 family)